MAGKARYQELSTILRDTTLRKRVHAAATQKAAIKLLKAAGAKQGVKFSDFWLRQATSEMLVPGSLGLPTPD